jgi:DtxR family Mn-dependent transcriptional regulator
MLSLSEENYLKIIYKIEKEEQAKVSTNAISEQMHTKASSVSDMLKKLAQKELIHYIKYQDITLTPEGQKKALLILRKHRLWETFLVEKLHFQWDEVHEIAEELEHIQSDSLINRLDEFLNFPPTDPHGDPIPDASGQIRISQKQLFFHEIAIGSKGIIHGVRDTSTLFLKYLTKIGIGIGSTFELTDRMEYDQSVELRVNGRTLIISREAAQNIYTLE